MGRLDDIERRVPHCTDSKDLDTLLRLARLAERSIQLCDWSSFNLDIKEEIRAILHPAPAKGHVAWFRNCEPAFSSHLADGVTLDEAKAAFAPTPPVAPPKGETSVWATERAMEIAKGRPLLNDCVHATFCIAVHELAEYLDRDESCWKLRAKAYQDEISELKRAHKGGS